MESNSVNCPTCGGNIRNSSQGNNEENCPHCTEVTSQQEKASKSFSDFIINFFSWFVAIPVFIILHKIVPDPDWFWHIDRILLALATLAMVRIILKIFRPLVIGIIVLMLGWLCYGSLWGDYGFRSVYRDYKAMIWAMVESPKPINAVVQKLVPFPNADRIKNAVVFNDSVVRTNAHTMAKLFDVNSYRGERRTHIQCFSIFKSIKNKWEYISDPEGSEYFANARESIGLLSGDCDDYSILMVSCIKAIGGRARFVSTNNHIYPELFIGSKSDFEDVNLIIRKELFEEESWDKIVYYHIDETGNYWMNMDYTDDYPGGEFMDNEVISILEI